MKQPKRGEPRGLLGGDQRYNDNMSSTLESVDLRRFTVADYYRMADVRVIDEDERVELIDGVVCQMSPEDSRHAAAIEIARKVLGEKFGSRFGLRMQHPLTLSDMTEPEPDVAVVEHSDPRAYVDRHPTSAALVIEVARSSLDKDLGAKATQYAAAGIPEYWVENLVDDRLEVFRSPTPAGYQSRNTLRRGDTVRPLCAADVEFEVDELLP